MNKFILVSISFVLGAAAGFAAGYFLTIEEDEATRVYGKDIKPEQKPEEKPAVEVPVRVQAPVMSESISKNGTMVSAQAINAVINQTPDNQGVDYSKVAKIVAENGYTPAEDDSDDEQIEKDQAASEYRAKNKDKIVPLTAEEWEVDFPTEDDYPRGDLHYFVEDDLFTDDDGNPINEEEYIGTRPRQFGWMANNEDRIYIRNNPKETDFVVWKHKCTAEDWWGE